VTYLVAVAVGACMGSFANVLIDRLPAGVSILGRSRCDGCRRALSPYELVPVLSWVLLRARCRTCGARIPVRVPFVEAFSALLGAFALAQASSPAAAAALFLSAWALLPIAFVDARTKTIPDALTLCAFAGAVAYQWLETGAVPVVGPAVAAGFFALQWLVSRGRWVGSGDVLLAAAIGMLLGTPHAAVWLLLASYGLGASTAIVLLKAKRLSRRDMIPFGPFLVAAGYLVLVAAPELPAVPGL
jgi:leader peptidase (prepilin peptidase)/N-methyltransferase